METQIIRKGIVLGLLFLLPLMATPAFAGKMEIVRLSDTMIIAQTGTPEAAGRSFALNTARGIVVIDTHNSLTNMQQAKALIEAEFKRHDYAFVIDSHDHPEHVRGNGLFDRNIVVGQEGIIEGLNYWKTRAPEFVSRIDELTAREEKKLARAEKDSPEFKKSSDTLVELRNAREEVQGDFVYPTITFSDRLTLNLGDRTVKLISFGRGHSYSDILIYIPEEKVLLTGGTCSLRQTPPAFPGYTGRMDVDRWVSVLSEFVDSDVELKYIIPGHTPYLTKSDLTFLRDYYRTLWVGLSQARKDGQSLDQVKMLYSITNQFASFSRLTNSSKMVKRHKKNIQELWKYLNRPVGGTNGVAEANKPDNHTDRK